MKKFNVIEDNGGGLTLVVFKEKEYGEISYIHTGYEYYPGDLKKDIELLKNGADPAQEWDGNELENLEKFPYMKNPYDFENWFPWEQKGLGWDIIYDNDGIYPEKMGTSGRYELC